MFDHAKRVIGTVSYGATGCAVPGGYNIAAGGKFSVHWDGNGSTPNRWLKPWLDPLNSGVMALDGKAPGLPETVESSAPTPVLRVDPSPTRGPVEIELGAGDSGSGRAFVYDLHGRRVLEFLLRDGRGRANLGALPTGIYFVTARGTQGPGRKILVLR